MTNITNKDIVYLNHSSSAMSRQHNENSSMPNSLANILKSGITVIVDDYTEMFSKQQSLSQIQK